MKKIKGILKTFIAFVICTILLYTFAIKVIDVYGEDNTVIDDYNYEEYYVYNN